MTFIMAIFSDSFSAPPVYATVTSVFDERENKEDRIDHPIVRVFFLYHPSVVYHIRARARVILIGPVCDFSRKRIITVFMGFQRSTKTILSILYTVVVYCEACRTNLSVLSS